MDTEEKIAQEILEDIKRSAMEAMAALDGAESDYYQRFYKYFYLQQAKIARMCGLPLHIIERIVALISGPKILPIGQKLLEENVEYSTVEDGPGISGRDQVRLKEKESELEVERDLEDEQEEIEEEINVDILAKMSSARQKKDAKEILKRLLICMIAVRMDPKCRAGETAQSNVKHAQIYRRENKVSLKDLVKAGVISSAVFARLNSRGIFGHNNVSVKKLQSLVTSQKDSLLDMIRGEKFSQSATRIPGKSEGLFSLSKVRSSLGIFSGTASNIGSSSNVSAGFTQFVQNPSRDGGRSR
ncbi:hypothetical protein NHE_0619 [Neorickettsia helminthoeca str. Oregon]|uniref:Uncharacterized protein n=1 Tax=Neorickettsia helminthoeca str. Oregon TaxID=1286528 RepID=X5HKI6_9RICK|nr:hypothetical protein [Neorickettsia helminthoeca]AHX11554.1 hypothetical protein NHE_0619 [Neorickettsia helminthoeca str. Oregon]